jgi:hypothetical protein
MVFGYSDSLERSGITIGYKNQQIGYKINKSDKIAENHALEPGKG